VSEADLNTPEQGVDSNAVPREVGEEPCDGRGGGDGGLEEADVGVVVDGGDNLLLQQGGIPVSLVCHEQADNLQPSFCMD
jgi:hypothetical protein